MNPQSHDTPQDPTGAPPVAPAPVGTTRPMYWSVRREVWENRSIYLGPLIVAAVVLFASLIGTIGLPKRMRTLSELAPAKRHVSVVRPISLIPTPIMLTTFLVGIFYALDALYGERRDRSILFWKSLPVSDRTTVLSKASIPLVVLPLIAIVLSLIAQTVLLFASTTVLLGSGVSPGPLWTEFRFLQEPVVMVYGLGVHILWFAPIYAWLLLISAWARRTPLLWAVLPVVALLALERMAFNTSHFVSWLKYRVTGAMTEAFAVDAARVLVDRVAQLSPARFLSSAGLWSGLVFAAACLAAAVRLRRSREPI